MSTPLCSRTSGHAHPGPEVGRIPHNPTVEVTNGIEVILTLKREILPGDKLEVVIRRSQEPRGITFEVMHHLVLQPLAAQSIDTHVRVLRVVLAFGKLLCFPLKLRPHDQQIRPHLNGHSLVVHPSFVQVDCLLKRRVAQRARNQVTLRTAGPVHRMIRCTQGLPIKASSERELYSENSDTTIFIDQDVSRSMERSGYSVKAGVDYQMTESSTVSLSGKMGNFGFGHDMGRKTTRAIEPGDVPTSYSLSNSDFLIDHDYYSLSVDYQNKFDDKGHKLDGSVYYSNSASNDENQWASEITNSEWEVISENYKEQNIESGNEDELQVKLDYTRPTSQGKLEAGYMGSYDYSDNQYEVERFINNDWNSIDSLYNSYEYVRLIHALYATYHGEIIGINYKLGLRGEYTNRQLSQNIMDKTYKIDRFDLFPSAHFSKELSKGEQLFLSYSRRIRRPRSWYLDPFPRQPDQYSKRIGNPNLKPEYTGSYELGYKKSFNKSFFSVETYYRRTTDQIDRIRVRGENEEMLRTFKNLDTETSFGVESMINTSLYKWWDLNANARLYRYSIEGNVTGQDVSAKSNNWNARLTNTFKLPTNTRLQLMGGYRGPSATSQGEREGFLMSSAAIKQSMLDKKMNITLSVRDLFQTMKYEMTSTGKYFREYNRFEREAPIFRLSISYSFNNYKAKKRGVNGAEENFEGRGEF